MANYLDILTAKHFCLEALQRWYAVSEDLPENSRNSCCSGMEGKNRPSLGPATSLQGSYSPCVQMRLEGEHAHPRASFLQHRRKQDCNSTGDSLDPSQSLPQKGPEPWRYRPTSRTTYLPDRWSPAASFAVPYRRPASPEPAQRLERPPCTFGVDKESART